MVNFSLLNKSAGQKKPASLSDTFGRLDRKVSHVELRASQVDLFRKIDARIEQRDMVLKLNTGGGKTTTGLIYLKHMMDKYGEPVVFLVPTTQLAEQVVDEGERLGLQISVWAANEKHPPENVIRCEAVMVCTYEKFFNGKSTFARSDVRLIPCAIVLDDVHAGVEAIRKCFSASLSPEARRDLLDLLGSALSEAEPANWMRISSADPDGLLEVPHWIISENSTSIRRILFEHNSESPLVFSWPYLERELDLCRIVVSGKDAAITMDPPLVDYVDHYSRSKHRLFMSASVHDGAALIRELGCNEAAAAEPVQVDGENAVGERMVLVPSLIDPAFPRDDVLRVAVVLSEHANVVVLVPSEAAARFWTDGGAVMALGEKFSLSVARLRTQDKGNFVVFVNRYDGIDLPDAACRILIVDGLPAGEGIVDRLDNENAGGLVGMRGKLANRVEQGLGRAVRSSSDYCAVILCGQELANFVSRRLVLDSFSPNTVRQIEMGRLVSKAISEDANKASGLIGALAQLLNRDKDWRNFYESQMSLPTDSVQSITAEAELRRRTATAERAAATSAQHRDYSSSSRELRAAANLLSHDRFARGVIKQAAAKVMYLHDKVAAMDLQGSAYADNCALSRPPVMPTAARRKISGQAERVAEWIRGFADKNGALLELDGLASKLIYSGGSNVVEAAVQDLGEFLGADSSRPEKEGGRGPDNLWIFGDRAFCIEMKSDKSSKLWKKDAGQLAVSGLWVRENITGLAEIFSVIGSNVSEADVPGDFEAGVIVMSQDAFLMIVSRLRGMLVGLINQGPLFAEDPGAIQGQLGPHELLPQQLTKLGSGVR